VSGVTIRRSEFLRLARDPDHAVDPDRAFDPVVIDFDKSTDWRVYRSRSELPLGVMLGDKSNRVIGLGVAAADNLLAEVALYPRQAVGVPLLSFGMHLCEHQTLQRKRHRERH